jgi:hypothetical protein
VTEAEWLAGTNFKRMLEFAGGKVSQRKLQLYAVACHRRVPAPWPDEGVALFQTLELFADGRATFAELEDAYFSVWEGEIGPGPYGWRDAYLVAETAWNFAADRPAEARAQQQLARCLFGNPFWPIIFDPAWGTATTTAVARANYEDRRFSELPILGDALDDAGCTDAALLDHCRGPGPHARGCWVVDLLLANS